MQEESGCNHTDEQHELIQRITFYADPEQNITGASMEADQAFFKEIQEVFGFHELASEIHVAARHMHEYHPMIEPELLLDRDGGQDILAFLAARAKNHAEAMMESAPDEVKERIPPHTPSILIAFGMAVLMDGMILGTYMRGDCAADHQHGQFDEVVDGAEKLLEEVTDGNG